jgi:hypothetical protein
MTNYSLQSICDYYVKSSYAKEAMPEPLNSKTEESHLNDPVFKMSSYKANWFIQFRALLWRSFFGVLREPMITSVRIVQTVVITYFLVQRILDFRTKKNII